MPQTSLNLTEIISNRKEHSIFPLCESILVLRERRGLRTCISGASDKCALQYGTSVLLLLLRLFIPVTFVTITITL